MRTPFLTLLFSLLAVVGTVRGATPTQAVFATDGGVLLTPLTSLGSTPLNASFLSSGTVPDARFPATLPALSAANLTNIPAANITGTLPAISGANLIGLNASNIATGSLSTNRLASNALRTIGASTGGGTALFDLDTNTTATLGFSNITASFAGLGSTPLDASKLTGAAGTLGISTQLDFTRAATGENNSTFKFIIDPFGNRELCLTVDQHDANTLQLRNPNTTGYAAINCVRDDSLGCHAVGIGGTNSVYVFRGASYSESSSPPGVGGADAAVAPDSRVIITQQYPAPAGYTNGFKLRRSYRANGDMIWFRNVGVNEGDVLDGSHNAAMTIKGVGDTDKIVVQFGSQFLDGGGAYWSADDDIELRFPDAEHAFAGRVLRSGADSNDFYCYGGTLANNGGYNFYSGGLRGSQSIRWTISNDAVKATVPIVSAGGAQWTSGTGSPEGAVTAGVGSLYSRTDGGAGTSLYVKESGTGNTGWVAK